MTNAENKRETKIEDGTYNNNNIFSTIVSGI